MTELDLIGCAAREAYVDGELTALESAAFDRHMADCAECQREVAGALRLRAELRGKLTRHEASADLRRRLLAQLPDTAAAPGASASFSPARASRRTSRREWFQMAAAASIAAVLAGSATLYAVRPGAEADWVTSALNAHRRATLSDHVFDVASSDRHTVKPWFGGKTSVAPVVVDLKAAGYPLLGGRLDIPQAEPLPVLVYQAGPHVVSLFVRAGSGDSAPELRHQDGFAILSWRERNFDFTAVSDADAAELGAFQRAFSAALAQLP